jgi:hypothetical protein
MQMPLSAAERSPATKAMISDRGMVIDHARLSIQSIAEQCSHDRMVIDHVRLSNRPDSSHDRR